mmetsp:Transcript_20125/g.43349  ORF Transcript_20125/g.43349 Transcript_20125/m.43349 type:complete len:218 (-) Transcript_20125:2078-2731(-)
MRQLVISSHQQQQQQQQQRTTQQQKPSDTTAPDQNNKQTIEVEKRSMVGGFSDVDLQSEELVTVASFALNEFVTSEKSSMLRVENSEENSGESGNGMASLVLLPEEVERGVVRAVVLEAQRQVVAGLNYKLTLGVVRSNTCLGAFKVTVYNRFGELNVISWGKMMGSVEVLEAFGSGWMGAEAAQVEEGSVGGLKEENALRVEEEVSEERQEVQPDA